MGRGRGGEKIVGGVAKTGADRFMSGSDLFVDGGWRWEETGGWRYR